MPTVLRRMFLFAATLLILIAAIGVSGYLLVQGSLPKLSGQIITPGLVDPVSISRDIDGVPDIQGTSNTDTAFGLGYLHAQERFFQMDQYRRYAAGELSELFGQATLEQDKKNRLFRFRERARKIYQNLSPADKSLLNAYTQGVNSGLSNLMVRPFEYLLLATSPKAWQTEDSILVQYSFFLYLQSDEGARELSLNVMNHQLPESWYNFLYPAGGNFDTPLTGDQFQTAPLPDSGWPNLDFSDNTTEIKPELFTYESRAMVSDTGHQPWIFNSFSLEVEAPNLWYRARWQYGDIQVTGLTVPGIPLMIAGNNGHVSWGVSSAEGDWSDLIILNTNRSGTLYETADGWQNFTNAQEAIRISDGDPEILQVLESKWGPVISRNSDGQLLALKWVALEPDGVNFQYSALEKSQTVDQALTVAASARMAEQDFLVVDREGNMGWTITGAIPKRQTVNGLIPNQWIERTGFWQGTYSPVNYPSIRLGQGNRLWAANNRLVAHSDLTKIGAGDFKPGSRARLLRELPHSLESEDRQDELIQYLNQSVDPLLIWWKDALVRHLESKGEKTRTRQDEILLRSLKGNDLSLDSQRLILAFRQSVFSMSIGRIYASLAHTNPEFRPATVTSRSEYALQILITSQPENLIPIGYFSWEHALNSAVESARTMDSPKLEKSIEHRLSIFPGLKNLLNYDNRASQASDLHTGMPTVNLTASAQILMFPENPEQDRIALPLSQSGHPMSPYYIKPHLRWLDRQWSWLAPQDPVYRLDLLP